MAVEDQVVGMIALKLVELENNGHSEAQSMAAIKRARKWATAIANKIGNERVRQEAFLELFEQGLTECENWIQKTKEAMIKA